MYLFINFETSNLNISYLNISGQSFMFITILRYKEFIGYVEKNGLNITLIF